MTKKVGRKIYINKDVYTSAKERIATIFDDFENIVCSLSGGKDSTVMLYLALEEAEKRKELMKTYAKAYGPLTTDCICDLEKTDRWQLQNGPAPWEGGII